MFRCSTFYFLVHIETSLLKMIKKTSKTKLDLETANQIATSRKNLEIHEKQHQKYVKM